MRASHLDRFAEPCLVGSSHVCRLGNRAEIVDIIEACRGRILAFRAA